MVFASVYGGHRADWRYWPDRDRRCRNQHGCHWSHRPYGGDRLNRGGFNSYWSNGAYWPHRVYRTVSYGAHGCGINRDWSYWANGRHRGHRPGG